MTTVDHHLFRSASGIPPERKEKRKPKILIYQREKTGLMTRRRRCYHRDLLRLLLTPVIA